MRKKLIIYDLDGTLVDTAEDICQAANHMLQELGHAHLELAEVSRYVGSGVHHLVGSCLKSDDRKLIERGIKIYRNFYANHMTDHSHLYEGVDDTLNYFQGRHQVVLTNKPNPYSQRLLEVLGVAHYFERVIAAGDNGYTKKPNPSVIHEMLETWKLSPAEAVVIGDSLIDIELAKNAQIEIAVLLHGFGTEAELKTAEPIYAAKNFPELLNFIQKRGW